MDTLRASSVGIPAMQALEAWPEIAWAWDAHTGRLIFNGAGRQSFGLAGLAANDLCGTLENAWQPLIEETDFSLLREACQKGLAGGTAWETDVRVRTVSSGDANPAALARWHRLRAAPVRDANGRTDALTAIWLGSCSDVHELKAQALEAVERQESYHSLVQHSSESIWRFSLEKPLDISWEPERQLDHLYAHGYLSDCNPSMAATYGFERPQDLHGARLEDLMPRAEAANRDYLLHAIDNGYRVRDVESIEYDRHGQKLHLLNSFNADIRDGFVYGAWGTSRDMTTRVQAEHALRTVDERYQRAAQFGHVGIWEMDVETQAFYMAPELKAMLGYADHEIENHLHAWCPLVHPEDLPKLEQAVGDHLSGKTAQYETEVRRRHKEGHYLWFLSRGTAIRDATGRPLQVVGADVDITERKAVQEAFRKTEEMLRAVVQTTPECVKVVNRAGALLYMNRAGVHAVEADSEAEVVGQSVYGLIAPESLEEWQRRHERICGGETMTWEFEIVTRRGTRHWMEAHATPFELPDHSLGHLAVTRNVTQRRQMEAQREHLLHTAQAAQEEAEEASRIKDDFLATLSHELRTPLNAIVGWSQILREDDVTPEDIREGLDVIDRNARAQAKMIEDLLDMSRIISGKIRLDLQTVHITAVIEAVMQTLRPAAQAKGVRLRPLRSVTAPAIQADPNRLQQVFWNLISNAIKFTPAGGVVGVSLHRAGRKLEVSVTDSGQGIDPAFLNVIFERFRQADGSSTRRFSGLGLGLSIARHLVELHGGTISCASEGLGQGSSFAVALPLAAPVSATAPHGVLCPGTELLPAEAAFTNEALPDLSQVHILIVDDEPDARVLVKRMLENCGAKVTTTSTVAEALRVLQENPPMLLVSDIGMPDQDGYALIDKVRHLAEPRLRSIPTIALTAFARSEDRVKALASGFDSHLSKPVQQRELTDLIARLMTRR